MRWLWRVQDEDVDVWKCAWFGVGEAVLAALFKDAMWGRVLGNQRLLGGDG